MLDLVLIVILIISISKPDILLAKKYREKASEEQKTILVKNTRKNYAILIALFESLALMRYSGILGTVRNYCSDCVYNIIFCNIIASNQRK